MGKVNAKIKQHIRPVENTACPTYLLKSQHSILNKKKSTCHQAKLDYNVDVTIKTYTVNSNEAGRKEITELRDAICASLILQ